MDFQSLQSQIGGHARSRSAEVYLNILFYFVFQHNDAAGN